VRSGMLPLELCVMVHTGPYFDVELKQITEAE